MNVLCIDYDYFQVIFSNTILAAYPGNMECTSAGLFEEWNKCYKENPYLKDITVAKREIYTLKLILENQRNIEAIMIGKNDRDCYDFILDYADKEDLSVTNVDLHHDLFNNVEELDNGNWLGYLMKDFSCNVRVEWVANPISKLVYGIEKNNSLRKIIKDSLSEIKDRQYDLIFLCRSDGWCPPHLYSDFDGLVMCLKNVSDRNHSVFLRA